MEMKGGKELKVWVGKQIKPRVITPEERKVVLNHNILMHLLHHDNPSFFLALKTAGKPSKPVEVSYEDLLQVFKKSYPIKTKWEDMLSSALDTLLDFGIFKAFWKKECKNNVCVYRRYFVNRNEVFDVFAEFREEINKKLVDANFYTVTRRLFPLILLNEHVFLNDDLYFEERIKRVERDLERFFLTILKDLNQGKKIILLPTLRKGYTLFEHFIKHHPNVKIKPEIISYTISPELKKADKIYIFDDASDKGVTVEKYVRKLLRIGVDPSKIYIAIFVVNTDEYPEGMHWRKIKELLKIENLEERVYVEIKHHKKGLDFHRAITDIIMLIGSYASIIDVDHLIVEIELEEGVKIDRIIESQKLLNIGVVLEPAIGLQYLHPDKKKITIDRIDYRNLTGEDVHEFIDHIEQCKIREIWEYNAENSVANFLTIAPVINPVIRIEKNVRICSNPPALQFCKKKRKTYELCKDCLIYHMSKILLLKFLEKLCNVLPLKSTQFKIKWIELEEKYDFVKEDINKIKEEINTLLS